MTEREVLIDFVALAKNMLLELRTGRQKGPSFRDCLGQWEATVREAEELVGEVKF